ncbi:hemolysin family protein [Ureibacillus terrenus]|uniref:HlyC/CorC family transporter n=1 Tax=Ureibacillus terrenus TaxID=118246 RepID=A0A540V176_9BACL|nr:hemolysin family protein [Ureibacillus terrenus]MED3663009.1 hemolysin family protein [Ureibacillus terrenus]MED3765082.1 hemolysin family protein [Ureibacillus terrenus]TQE90457.1 HlyC/CorC family transporter [Ureibacillus terrenus]
MSTLIVLILLIFLNSFFAASEFALVELNEIKIKKLANEGNRKAKLLDKLISEPSRFLSTIQIGITLAGFLASAFAADSFSDEFAAFLYDAGVPLTLETLDIISVVFITAILSYFTLVFGELVPKKIALQQAERVANLVVYPLIGIFYVCYPLVKVLSLSTSAVLRLLKVDEKVIREEATEEQIRLMVELGGIQGTINKSESKMIQNIFEFNDKLVSDIFTHRVDIAAIPVEATLEETLAIVDENRYTRFPVYEEDIDHIVGILHVKDLLHILSQVDEKEEFQLKNIIRKPIFVIDSLSIDVLFQTMRKSDVHMAIVIDEYGGTAGLVTIEDIIEEIVGEIESETNAEEKEIQKIGPDQYLIKGVTHLYKIEEQLNIHLPSEDFDTLNGFLLEHVGQYPFKNKVFEYENLRFQIVEADQHRIESVILTVLENKKKENENDGEYRKEK